MYCPSEKLASKLMKHYDIDYNWTLTEQQNVILASSTQNDNEKEVVRLCIRSLLPLKTIDGVCSLLLFMKRIQQNENTGVLTSD